MQATGGAALIGRTGQDGGPARSGADHDGGQPSGARPQLGEVTGTTHRAVPAGDDPAAQNAQTPRDQHPADLAQPASVGRDQRAVETTQGVARDQHIPEAAQTRPAGQTRPDGESRGGEPAAALVPAGRRRAGLLVAVAALVLIADLLTKVAVVATLSDRPPVKLLGGLLYLVQARNAGAAFSFAQGATVVFTAIAALVIVIILRSATQLRSLPWAVSLGLILGGAAGNLADRLFRSPGPLRGHVVDWISLLDPGGRVWPVFNVADSCIVVGGILAVLLAFAGYELTGTRTRRRS